ncbi:uncharacterized protein A4U43_C07F31270 [Asparagus officinalis]|uniref:Uncharacterized protein n=1 Tax=Asparagus officinalis TaxID=4686 RepID=A0A5P1EJY0_ASPOF|nr:uncharacterized protein A4U43_C07F31270 [Asparagus officinalis]
MAEIAARLAGSHAMAKKERKEKKRRLIGGLREVQAVAAVEAGACAEDATDPSPRYEPSYKPGNYPARTSGGVEEQAVTPPKSLVGEAGEEQEDNFYWSFCHWVSEFEPQVWEKSKAMLMGVLSCLN